jgi:hypothetical protein
VTTRSIGHSAIFCLAATLSVATAGSNQAKAYDIITTNPGLPPTSSLTGIPAYVAQNPVSYPQYGVELLNPFYHFGFTDIVVIPSGPNELASFDSTLSGSANVGGTIIPFTLTGPVNVTTFGNVGMVTGTFAEQMTSMDLTGQVAGHSVELMLNPTPASTGSTTITDLGGGLFDIHSFFDVFTELSIDGGAFAPGSGSTLLTLSSIPEPSTWIMYVTAGLIVSGYARWRRRRT